MQWTLIIINKPTNAAVDIVIRGKKVVSSSKKNNQGGMCPIYKYLFSLLQKVTGSLMRCLLYNICNYGNSRDDVNINHSMH